MSADVSEPNGTAGGTDKRSSKRSEKLTDKAAAGPLERASTHRDRSETGAEIDTHSKADSNKATGARKGNGRRRFSLRRRRERRVPIRALIPNVITLMGLSAGLTSIRMAIDGRLELAIMLIVLAGALDGIDGRVARLLKAASKFGAELDSLADFVNFGVAPAILLFTWGLNDLKSFGWIAALAFSISAALRLARFNVSIEDPNKAQWLQKYFVGIPAPAGALLVMLPLYLYQSGLEFVRDVPALIAIYMVMMAGLMVSTLPSFSGKLLGARIKFAYVMPLTVAGVLVAAILFTYPYITLSVICLLYLISLPFGVFAYRRDLAKFGLEGEQ